MAEKWERGASDRADCEECDWEIGPDKDQLVLSAARDHIRETGHTVIRWREWWQVVAARRS